MKYIQSTNLSLGLLSFSIVSVNAFQPSLIKTKQPLHQFASKNVDVDFFNPAKELDLAHAHDCAEHFGKCAVEDLENMRKGKIYIYIYTIYYILRFGDFHLYKN